MKQQITGLSDDYINNVQLIDQDGETLYLKLSYRQQNYGWYFDIDYGDFHLYGNRLVLSDDIIPQFSNKVVFTISCEAEDGVEPMELDCFSSERVKLYVE